MRSSTSAGSNSHSAVPPLLNQTSGASGALGVRRPRTLGMVATDAHFARPRFADAVGQRAPPIW